mgnify:CR=1 FL=1
MVKKFTVFLNRSRSFASQYICISEATKNDLLDYLSNFNSDVPAKTWPLAHEFEGYRRNEKHVQPPGPELLKKIQKPFVLCVGTIEVRKNGIALLKVWQRLLKELGDKTPQLVFAGKYGWKIKPFQDFLQSDTALQQVVTIIPQATDADLAALYQKCLFFVYPSLVEGWGLPVGEAAWFGKYSVVSLSSSLPEVCGDFVDYVDCNGSENQVVDENKDICQAFANHGNCKNIDCVNSHDVDYILAVQENSKHSKKKKKREKIPKIVVNLVATLAHATRSDQYLK